jgi:hypothetical protein
MTTPDFSIAATLQSQTENSAVYQITQRALNGY